MLGKLYYKRTDGDWFSQNNIRQEKDLLESYKNLSNAALGQAYLCYIEWLNLSELKYTDWWYKTYLPWKKEQQKKTEEKKLQEEVNSYTKKYGDLEIGAKFVFSGRTYIKLDKDKMDCKDNAQDERGHGVYFHGSTLVVPIPGGSVKFWDIKIGGYFKLDGDVYRKTNIDKVGVFENSILVRTQQPRCFFNDRLVESLYNNVDE